MERHDGGRDQRVVMLSRAPEQPLPADVARLLSHLAHVIDDTIEARGVGIGVREFAESFLGVDASGIQVASADLGGISFHLAALALADDLAAHPPVRLIGEDQEEPPRWERLELGDDSPRIPLALAGAFEAGTIAAVDLVVGVGPDWQHEGFRFSVFSRSGDADAGQAYLDDLLVRGRTGTNPYRNRVLEAGFQPPFGLVFRGAELAASARADLVLPDEVWQEIDGNVHGLFAARDRLAAAGLGTNRGLLLEGPPGTGKTAVCRAVAGELQGRATVVFCDARTVARAVRYVYRQLEFLAPALVVMEDVDLVLADRRDVGGSGPLNDFLLALDGAMTQHSGVVTIATTNDVSAIDPAARRAARFDRIVHVPPPDRVGRAAILTRYLRGLADDVVSAVDVDHVARATEGATGADLRELVTRAVLHMADAERSAPGRTVRLDTMLLSALAADRDADAHPGQYL